MSRCFSVWPLCFSSLFLLTLFDNKASAQSFQGRKVMSVTYEPAAQPPDRRDLATMQLVQVGRPLDEAQVAATIDRLYASGLYNDIQVDAEPSGNGVAIRFITKARLFIGHVGAEGSIKDPPSRPVIISDSQLSLGAPFDPDTLAQAQKTIEQEMRNNGLYEAQVSSATVEDPDTHQVTVRFMVDAGKRARYEAPAIEGDIKLSDSTIIKATGWRVPLIHRWRQVTSALTDAGNEGIRKAYSKKNRLTATVDMKSLDYNSDTNRAKATFDINAGPLVQIKAVEAKISKGKLRSFVPVYQEGSVDNDLLTEGARNLHDYFQSRGYPDVDVTFRSEPVVNDKEIINYYIATGPRRKLVAVNIEGDNYFMRGTLDERMFLKPASLIMKYGRYSETFRDKDEQAIEALYQANGFRDVKVTSSVQTNYKGKPEDIAATFHIYAGKQWTVASLRIEGANQVNLTPLQADLSSAVGQPFAAVNVASDRNLILKRYYSEGFPNASFSFTQKNGAAPQTIDLFYHVIEGPREFVRRAIVSGLYRTKPRLVDRRITLQDGQPLDMEKVNAIAQQLSNLGVFASVNTAIQDPNGTNRYKYILYDFEEAARYTFSFGFGIEIGQFGHTTQNLADAAGTKGVSPLVSASVSRLNMFGLGQTLSLDAKYSTLEQRESINYIIPRFLYSDNRTLTLTGLYDTTQDVQTFAVRRLEGIVQLSQRFNRASTLLTRFSYRRDSPNTTLPVLNTPAFTGTVRIGEFSVSYIQDHRDNPADAHHGFWNTLDAGIAGNFFGSQRNFYRFLARNATYTSFGKFVLARQTQIGGIIPFEIPAGLNRYDVIPLPERMFGGGSVSMRGFGDNQAGPRDIGTATETPGPQVSAPTGFPIGGDALFFNNVELRFPLIFPNVSGVLFEDMGNIYSTFSNISFSYRQPNTGPIPYQDFNYAVQAPGFGIRYKTPIGPVRVDFAYTMNPTTYQGFSRSQSISTIANCQSGVTNNPSSPCYVSPQSLGHFVFFFSIGQAF